MFNVLPSLNISMALPTNLPIIALPATNTSPDSIIPNTIDAPTIILGSTVALSGNPKMPTAILSPATPPTKDPGSNPTIANSTRPAPTPMYNPFFVASPVFISLYLLWCSLCCIYHNKSISHAIYKTIGFEGFELFKPLHNCEKRYFLMRNCKKKDRIGAVHKPEIPTRPANHSSLKPFPGDAFIYFPPLYL